MQQFNLLILQFCFPLFLPFSFPHKFSFSVFLTHAWFNLSSNNCFLFLFSSLFSPAFLLFSYMYICIYIYIHTHTRARRAKSQLSVWQLRRFSFSFFFSLLPLSLVNFKSSLTVPPSPPPFSRLLSFFLSSALCFIYYYHCYSFSFLFSFSLSFFLSLLLVFSFEWRVEHTFS